MPTYQYACTECGHAFEQVQSFSDDALTVCPVCSGRLRKVFNAVGVVFKGSGFYRTDSRADTKVGVGAGSTKTEGGSESAEKKPAGASSDTTLGSSEKKSDTSGAKQPVTAGTGNSSNGSSTKVNSSSSSGSSTAA